LFVESLAAVQTHDLGDDLAEDTPDVGRIGKAAVTQPPFQAKQVDQLPAQVQSKRRAEADPDISEHPAQHEAYQRRGQKPARCEPPSLCRWLHDLGFTGALRRPSYFLDGSR
jgi:hypothetical protein